MSRALVFLIGTGMVAACFGIVFAQQADEPPGSIQLLTGYTHQRMPGLDTRVGNITKKGGMDISYDIGRPAGNHAASNQEGAAWFKEQTVNGHALQIAFTKDKRIFATYVADTANFSATLQSDEDLTDFLLMVLTYSPSR